MARLSESLIAGLANPSYSGMLGSAVSGGFQGIQDGYAANRGRMAQEAANAMLTGGDVNDPQVQQSVQAVYSQMNQDPAQAQQLIKAAQVEGRAQAEEGRAKKNFIEQSKYREMQMKTAQTQQEEEKAKKIALGKLYANPEKADEIIMSLPEELRPAAMAAVSSQLQYNREREAAAEEAAGRERIPEATLATIKATPGMDDAILAYEEMFKHTPSAANRRLLQQWDVAHTASLRTITSKKVTGKQVETMMDYIQQIDLPGEERWFRDSDVDPQYQLALAQKAAQKKNDDPGWDPTPPAIKAMYAEMLGEVADQKNKEEKARSEGSPRGGNRRTRGETTTSQKAAPAAPNAALEYLKNNPGSIDKFEDKYGYRPEGY
jgi:hypothetical protein